MFISRNSVVFEASDSIPTYNFEYYTALQLCIINSVHSSENIFIVESFCWPASFVLEVKVGTLFHDWMDYHESPK